MLHTYSLSRENMSEMVFFSDIFVKILRYYCHERGSQEEIRDGAMLTSYAYWNAYPQSVKSGPATVGDPVHELWSCTESRLP